MQIPDFQLERWQALHEHSVDANLAESSIEGLPLRVLAEASGSPEALTEALLDQRLAYTQTNGTEELRSRIAALYPGATAESVQVCNGGSEAIFTSCWHLMEPGAEMVVVVPNYPQVLGLAPGFGGKAVLCPLEHQSGGASYGRWVLDLDRLRACVSAKTRLIAVCTPNNPTGSVLTEQELEAIAQIAREADCWVLSDEIYRGSEHDGVLSATLWGRYEKLILISGMSKAYGLPGLRIGWAVSTPQLASELWRRRDYTTIAPTALGDLLARTALEPGTRERLLDRTRSISAENYQFLVDWAENNQDLLAWSRPAAGAFVFASYGADIPSVELAEQLQKRHSVLIAPGTYFGVDRYLRLGYGFDRQTLSLGLERLGELIRSRRT